MLTGEEMSVIRGGCTCRQRKRYVSTEWISVNSGGDTCRQSSIYVLTEDEICVDNNPTTLYDQTTY